MNPLFKRVARKTYHKAQENHLGKRFIILAFTMRKLTRNLALKRKPVVIWLKICTNST